MGLGLTGLKPIPGAVNQQGRSVNAPNQLPGEYLAQLMEQNKIQKLVNAYKAAPESYTEEEALQLQTLAVQAGIPFHIKSQPGALAYKSLLAGLDRAAFGLLPLDEFWKPVNAAERKAVAAGQTIGTLTGLPRKAFGMVMGGGGALLKQATKKWGGSTASKQVIDAAKQGWRTPITSVWKQGKDIVASVGSKAVAGGKTTATTVKKAGETIANTGKVGKNFGYSMNAIIKGGGQGGKNVAKGSGKGFWSAVNKGKTPEEKVKLGKAWILKNMHPSSKKAKNMSKRVEGWVKKQVDRMPINVKAPKKVPAPKKTTSTVGPGTPARDAKQAQEMIKNGINPKTGQRMTGKEILEYASGKQVNPFIAKTVRDRAASPPPVVKSTIKRTPTMDRIAKKIKSNTKYVFSKSDKKIILASMSKTVRRRISKLKGKKQDIAIRDWFQNKYKKVKK